MFPVCDTGPAASLRGTGQKPDLRAATARTVGFDSHTPNPTPALGRLCPQPSHNWYESESYPYLKAQISTVV